MVLLSRHTLVQGLTSLRHEERHTTHVGLTTRFGEVCDRIALRDEGLLLHASGAGNSVHARKEFVVRPALHRLADVDDQVSGVPWLHGLEVVVLASVLTLQPADTGLEKQCDDT